MQKHKAGFVNIIGMPNVGKSTLMNALVGENLCIVTPKPQTTRHRIIGIANDDNYQIVFSDTPGIVKPNYKLHDSMMAAVYSAILDADIFLYLLDINHLEIDENILEKINNYNRPLIFVINKIDKASEELIENAKAFLQGHSGNSTAIMISAKDNIGIYQLKNAILEHLPEHEAFYPKDDSLSDRTIRFFVSEMIRGKIFLQYSEEIPYSSEVVVDKYTEKEDITVISATIFVEKESQKGIIIGHKGKAIKKLGIASRLSIESFIDTKIYLELSVKVSPNWRENDRQLMRFGYELS